MRNPKRIPEILHAIELFWTKNPDWRLGQLIDNCAAIQDMRGRTFFMEDDMIIPALEELNSPPKPRK